MYDLGEHLLMVASDRISAFDYILPQTIPDKGIVLTQLSAYWFDRSPHLIQNHRVASDPDEIIAVRPELAETREAWAGRGMLVRRVSPFPVECVVRGYLAGSAWKEYRESGTLAGEKLPEGLQESERLPEPLFSPATKAEEGHDENITFGQLQRRLGQKTSDMLQEISLALYSFGRTVAARRGIIVADTKFEFGVADTGEVLLIDEVLTPDSSRFWDARQWEPGTEPSSFDKQYVRNWLDECGWDHESPPPELPTEVVDGTLSRYLEAFRKITGSEPQL